MVIGCSREVVGNWEIDWVEMKDLKVLGMEILGEGEGWFLISMIEKGIEVVGVEGEMIEETAEGEMIRMIEDGMAGMIEDGMTEMIEDKMETIGIEVEVEAHIKLQGTIISQALQGRNLGGMIGMGERKR